MIKEYMFKQIEIPTKCPSCSYPLQMIEMQLFCKNTACGAVAGKQIEHFCKTLGIKGMGEKTISKLGISDITEIYSLSIQDMTIALGSEKIAEKLYLEIQKSKDADLSVLLAAFGIPLIGNSASKKLCMIISDINEVDYETCKAAGLGDIATKNILRFLGDDFTYMRDYLPFTFKVTINTTSRGNICITGKLTSFKNKAEANNALIDAGFNVVGTVSKETDYLVDEDNKNSAKRIRANSLGHIEIITDLSKFLKEKINHE
jgi:DNA ligase (NAD+)